MRRLITASWIFVLAIVTGLDAQNLPVPAEQFNSTLMVESHFNSNESKLSGITKDLISDYMAAEKKNSILADSKKKGNLYCLRAINERVFAGALIKVNSDIDETKLKRGGVLVGTKAGNIWAVTIPVDFLETMAGLEGIEYIQVDEPVIADLDKAREATYADWVHSNSKKALKSTYKGNGVIVGVIDLGFDFTHPQFYDAQGTKSRISHCWVQDLEGTAPAGYGYGHEFSGEEALLQRGGDKTSSTHGTHVAGIAGGSGIGTGGSYVGIAPESELIFVSAGFPTQEAISTGQSTIVNGIDYIFKKAKAAGKPAVVNISLGVHIGPHDGQSLFDQACDELVGPGRVICSSAGNTGGTPLHIKHRFTTSKKTVATLVELQFGVAMVDIWGEKGKDMSVNISLIYDNKIISSTGYVSTMSNKSSEFNLVGSDGNTCYVSINGTPKTFNDKPRLFTMCQANTSDEILYYVKSNTGEIHMWNGGYASSAGARFYKGDHPQAIDGNTETTVGEIGGSGKSVITVGSYTTKNKYTNIYKQNKNYGFLTVGELSTFSSVGPTADGRVKPDICAPGELVVSSVSSFHKDYGGSSNLKQDVVTGVKGGEKTWYYAAMQGTSMSCPVVTGIVALMLEADPELTSDDVKAILKKTANEDKYTGNISSKGSVEWGWGKVDAHEALKAVKINPFSEISVQGDLSACFNSEATYNIDGGASNFSPKWAVVGGKIKGSDSETTVNVIWTSRPTVLKLIRNETVGTFKDTIITEVVVNDTPKKPTVSLSGVRLKSSSLSGNQWFCESEEIKGAVLRYYSPTKTGNFSVQHTSKACVSEMSDNFFYDMTGVENMSGREDEVDIYPNPADQSFRLFFKSDNPVKVSVKINDLLGKEQISAEYPGFTTEFNESISTAKLQNGIYMAIIQIGTKKIHRKIVVKH